MRLFVIVPMFNEAKGIAATLKALEQQSFKDFTAVFCDNNSTDNTREVVQDFIDSNELDWFVIEEKQKGTGWASDAAANAAIAAGATHIARTDADCIPAPNWLQKIVDTFETTDNELIAGLSLPRTDDLRLTKTRYRIMVAANEMAIAFGHVRPANYGKEFKGRYIMVAGNNVAISRDLYQKVGGFTHTSIEEAHEDRELIQAVRRVTNKYRFDRSLRVWCSVRRIEKWGITRSLLWYAGHYYRPKTQSEVDVR